MVDGGVAAAQVPFNQGDETVVAGWLQNLFWLCFCGMTEFQWQVSCDTSDLVCFRQRIGEAGGQRMLNVSARLDSEQARNRSRRGHDGAGEEHHAPD
jgi:hypothetical protein